MTKHPDLFAALAAPFERTDLKVRTQAGKELYYITSRTAMNRLDDVLGPENWWDEYAPSENSVLCRLTIRLPDGSTLTKCDAGGYAGMADPGDDDKSGYADAFKRACVKFGVARYLYHDGVPRFVESHPAAQRTDTRERETRSQPVANGTTKPRHEWPGKGPGSAGVPTADEDAPVTGKQLFRWCKQREDLGAAGLLRYLNHWARHHDFPGRMVDWNVDQVGLGYAEACRKLSAASEPSVN
jgi:hypothetical protein